MIPPLEKQNQLLPHDLVTKTKTPLIQRTNPDFFKALALSYYLYLTDVQVLYLLELTS